MWIDGLDCLEAVTEVPGRVGRLVGHVRQRCLIDRIEQPLAVSLDGVDLFGSVLHSAHGAVQVPTAELHGNPVKGVQQSLAGGEQLLFILCVLFRPIVIVNFTISPVRA